MSTKLYTEEQLINRMETLGFSPITIKRFIEELSPIELPTDEEINNEWEVGYSDYQNGCNYGAKWMRYKIGGNNGQQ